MIITEETVTRSGSRVRELLEKSSLEKLAFWRQRLGQEDGMATVEYAIGTLAAAAFAGLLLFLMKEGTLLDSLRSLIEGALKV